VVYKRCDLATPQTCKRCGGLVRTLQDVLTYQVG